MDSTRHVAWPPPGTLWYIKLLGRLEVSSSSNEIVRFRSRTALALLAFLALHKTKECSNEELQELFWPDSDSDRQSQNLRRAVADIRSVLEKDLPLGSVVVTRRNYVSLNPDRIVSDVERFLDLTKPGSDLESDSLLEAIGLYAGPLLAQLSDPWMLVERMELEERFAQLVAVSCRRRVKAGSVNEAVRIGRSAVAAAPYREDIHIALITAYRHADMETEALRQYEELERLLHEAWGESPSEQARLALMGELPTTDQGRGGEWDPSGGAMPMDSKFYVRREVDAQAEELIKRGEGVILVQGARQVGKSSLLARSLGFARSAKVSVVLTDAQALGESQLLETDHLYKTLAHGFAQQLGIAFDVGGEWSDWLGPNVNLDTIIGKLLAECKGAVCWAIDEADLLFERPYTNDFFGLLRSWHNRRALDPDGPWRKLTLVLTYATEAHLFISDLNQSPFNVGVRMTLKDFSMEEVNELQSRHGEMGDREAWRTVFEITHGHPFLSQCAFAFLAKGGKTDELAAKAARQDGPFGTHLNRMLVSIAQSEEMLSEVKRMLDGQPFENATTRYRLQSAGVISISSMGEPEFRVPIYETYLRAEIG
ncbi:MAG: AAA-like domain-containing protein [Armatimonadota bacterium]|nr:AAA-like domain-containing protein [Armatimonadota bacterium]